MNDQLNELKELIDPLINYIDRINAEAGTEEINSIFFVPDARPSVRLSGDLGQVIIDHPDTYSFSDNDGRVYYDLNQLGIEFSTMTDTSLELKKMRLKAELAQIEDQLAELEAKK